MYASYPFLFLGRTLMRFLGRKYGFHVSLWRADPEHLVLSISRQNRKNVIQRRESLHSPLTLPWWTYIVGKGLAGGLSRWFTRWFPRGLFGCHFPRGFSWRFLWRGVLFLVWWCMFCWWSEARCDRMGISLNHWRRGRNKIILISIFYPRLKI